MVKRPTGTVDGMDLKRYVPGEVYDVSASLADYLVMQGFGMPEMRGADRKRLKKKRDRREK